MRGGGGGVGEGGWRGGGWGGGGGAWGVTRKFKSGGLHERQAVATWKLGNHLSIRL
jgi:hypothetical protein